MKIEKKKIENFNLKGQVVLMRADLNTPFDENQKITDDTRIRACVPTIKYILKEGGAVILMSHIGRPNGKSVDSLSLKHTRERLTELLGQEVILASSCIGDEVQEMKKKLKPGEVLLLENTRFHEGEENPEKDPSFSEQLSRYSNIYVNDSFSSAHRNHASTALVASHFPGKACMGFSLASEEHFLKEKLLDPKRPFVAIVGGAKISSKIGVVKSLIEKADAVIIGGAMAHTFLKAEGKSIGKSLNEANYLAKAKEILEHCKNRKIPLILPIDLVVTQEIKEDSPKEVVSVDHIADNQIGVDIGPKTLELYEKTLRGAKTVFWNGPVGITEIDAFSKGTLQVAQLLAKMDATTIVGGGDSTAALKKLGLADSMTYISTGGGASLEYIEKGFLPGIEALSDSEDA